MTLTTRIHIHNRRRNRRVKESLYFDYKVWNTKNPLSEAEFLALNLRECKKLYFAAQRQWLVENYA